MKTHKVDINLLNVNVEEYNKIINRKNRNGDSKRNNRNFVVSQKERKMYMTMEQVELFKEFLAPWSTEDKKEKEKKLTNLLLSEKGEEHSAFLLAAKDEQGRYLVRNDARYVLMAYWVWKITSKQENKTSIENMKEEEKGQLLKQILTKVSSILGKKGEISEEDYRDSWEICLGEIANRIIGFLLFLAKTCWIIPGTQLIWLSKKLRNKKKTKKLIN